MAGSPRSHYLFLSLLQARIGASVVSRLGEVDGLLEVPAAEVASRAGMKERAARTFEELKETFDPGAMDGALARRGICVHTPVDEGHPDRLKEMPDSPPALYVHGEVPDAPAVAVVGSRAASPTGLESARSLGRALGERGVCVVSGLALGVDAAAHQGALEAGGPTVGVLGCGIDVVYPRGNRVLFGRVREAGALVSEYYLGEPPLAWRFPARNRIIAGLGDAVVVVEAPHKSGALITARHGAECGRDVWAVPGPLGTPECAGSNRLLGDGAGVLWDLAEFVETYAQGTDRLPGPAAAEPPVPDSLPEGEAAVLAGVGFRPTGVDEISVRSGIETPRVLSALALLELKGYVARGTGGAFVRRTSL
ncbi:MAG: putative processing protein DprA [Rubrobacteraceae bacterium]|nr:putative processing protein DprA [Rubrobacteraceae bacterium]